MLTSFTVTAGPGEKHVTLDGTDVSDQVQSAVVEVPGGDTIPQVTLVQHGPVAITGTGIVTVVRQPDDGDVAAAVVEFLESIDPTALDAMVSARFTSMASSPTGLTLQTLIDLAREVAGG
jgi:hypothetical protein